MTWPHEGRSTLPGSAADRPNLTSRTLPPFHAPASGPLPTRRRLLPDHERATLASVPAQSPPRPVGPLRDPCHHQLVGDPPPLPDERPEAARARAADVLEHPPHPHRHLV